LTITLIFWTLGFQRRRVRRCECEMLFPNAGAFPQMSHLEAIGNECYQSGNTQTLPAGALGS
jgi:hypothetical protein